MTPHARIYDALLAEGLKNRERLKRETGVKSTAMHRALVDLMAEGVVIEIPPSPATRYRRYKLAPGAVRPSEAPKPTGFQHMAKASRCEYDGAPGGLVRRAIATVRLDPLMAWAHREEIEA